MKNPLLISLLLLIIISCQEPNTGSIYVKNITELNNAIKRASPGDDIIMANGVWRDVPIKFYGQGTESLPITLSAETEGQVYIEGESYLFLGGSYLQVSGLYFRNGHSPKSTIIKYKINEDSTAFHSKISNCVIKDFTKPSRLTNDHWIAFYGKHNTLDHCYVSGKSNDGETLRVFQTGNKHNQNYHQITNNYFGPRPRKGGPRAETIRIGDSKTHMTPGYVNVSDNYFEACNGEVEIISDKTNFNTFRRNIFYKCEGSLVLRHGSFATVDQNIFIGGEESDFYGGIRVINTGHWITNNYFYKINGSQFRSPLAMMNGIPKSQLNRYRPVTDVVVAHNTWVDCKSPLQIGVGQNINSTGVLPEVEIRSASPIRSVIANNLIYNHEVDSFPVINHHNIDGIRFESNVIDNDGFVFKKYGTLDHQRINMKQLNEWLFAPEEDMSSSISTLFHGFEFDKIKLDLFGGKRSNKNYVGAISDLNYAQDFEINKGKYGPSWFISDAPAKPASILQASAKTGELEEKIAQAKSGDIIELTDSTYSIGSSLQVDKDVTIRSKDSKNMAQLIFEGNQNSPAFEMNPKGKIRLRDLSIKSSTGQLAFAPLSQNMSSAYNIFLYNCEVSDFSYLIHAYKGSFADSISLIHSRISNCDNGIVLAAEEKGDYNAEMVTISDCEFSDIQHDLINFYRGGYDESTIGGCLTIANSVFERCGTKEINKILLKTRGIINVNLLNNTFRNNPIKWVAVLWGVKNNHHSKNTLVDSGQIKVEEQQKLKILY